MTEVVKLLEQYQAELSDDVTLLRIRARMIRTELEHQMKRYQQKLELFQPQMHDKKMQLLDTITNLAPTNYDADKIMRAYTWSALILLATSVSSLLSYYFMSFFIGLILSGFATGLCAYIILPLVTYYYIDKASSTDKSAWNDMILRHALLAFAIAEGLLTGHVLSDRELAGSPPLAALTPLVIGAVTPIVRPFINKNRAALLVATIGGSFGLHMLIGMILGLTAPFVLLTFIYTVIGLTTLQLFISNVREDTVFTHIYQFSILYFTILSQFVIYELYGGK